MGASTIHSHVHVPTARWLNSVWALSERSLYAWRKSQWCRLCTLDPAIKHLQASIAYMSKHSRGWSLRPTCPAQINLKRLLPKHHLQNFSPEAILLTISTVVLKSNERSGSKCHRVLSLFVCCLLHIWPFPENSGIEILFPYGHKTRANAIRHKLDKSTAIF